MLKNNHRGRYNNDYSPKYSDPYDIYDKAKEHMQKLRKENDKKRDSEKSNSQKKKNE